MNFFYFCAVIPLCSQVGITAEKQHNYSIMTVVLLFHYVHESASQRKNSTTSVMLIRKTLRTRQIPHNKCGDVRLNRVRLYLPSSEHSLGCSCAVYAILKVHCVNIVEWKKRTTHVMLTHRPVATTYETLKRHNCISEITSFSRKNVTTHGRLTSVKQKKMYEGLPTCRKHATTHMTVLRY